MYTVKGFGIVNKAEIDVLLELSCFLHDPAHGGNETKPSLWGHPRRVGHDGEVWQNVVHWRRE